MAAFKRDSVMLLTLVSTKMKTPAQDIRLLSKLGGTQHNAGGQS